MRTSTCENVFEWGVGQPWVFPTLRHSAVVSPLPPFFLLRACYILEGATVEQRGIGRNGTDLLLSRSIVVHPLDFLLDGAQGVVPDDVVQESWKQHFDAIPQDAAR